jgi:hypothetical protein
MEIALNQFGPRQRYQSYLRRPVLSGWRGDETISAKKLSACLDVKVPQLTQQYRKKEQLPIWLTTGSDFPLAVRKVRCRMAAKADAGYAIG